MKRGALKSVEWVDSGHTPQWRSPDQIPDYPATCVTVGFIIHDTKEALTLAQTVRVDNNYGDVNGCMTIPKCCIKKIEALK